MKAVLLAVTIALVGGSFVVPADAQAQVQICGPPPLPPCEGTRPREGYSQPPGGRFGDVCRTRELRCRLDDPRPIGARCTCYDEDGEPERGRVVR